MTDLEICKRIAEIEGYRVSTDVKPSCGSVYANIYPDNCYGNYNPLTDKALCFDLMVKYELSIEPQLFNLTYAHIDYQHAVLDENPQKAICLAIIEAHKG